MKYVCCCSRCACCTCCTCCHFRQKTLSRIRSVCKWMIIVSAIGWVISQVVTIGIESRDPAVLLSRIWLGPVNMITTIASSIMMLSNSIRQVNQGPTMVNASIAATFSLIIQFGVETVRMLSGASWSNINQWIGRVFAILASIAVLIGSLCMKALPSHMVQQTAKRTW